MAIEKKVTKVKIGDHTVRYKTRVTSDQCEYGSNQADSMRILFFTWLAEQPHLLKCGPVNFQKVTITHNGQAWMAEAEAEVDEEPGQSY